MPRPKKATVDYFPHYCSHGKTLHILESKYGNDGYALWFKLLELMGAAENHFIDCNEPATWEYLLAKTLVSEEKATSILNMCSALGAINEKFWKARVIWSENFIHNLDAVYKRREIDVFTIEDIEGYCRQKHYLNGKSVNGNPQRRVKESRVEESKEESIPPTAQVKAEKLKAKLENKISDLNSTWKENLQLYTTKYPNLDHELERQKMECWMRDNPGKALKRSNLNMFCHSWLGRARPQYRVNRRLEVGANDQPADEPTIEEKILHWQEMRERYAAHPEKRFRDMVPGIDEKLAELRGRA